MGEGGKRTRDDDWFGEDDGCCCFGGVGLKWWSRGEGRG